VRAYVASLGQEAHEWLLALYVEADLQLLAVETVGRGDISSCKVPFWHLLSRAKLLGAAGFILVHNHPSGDPTASLSDIRTTARLAHVSRELEVPLLDHIIIAGDEMTSVGCW
jgi:DNA repair protein RadC